MADISQIKLPSGDTFDLVDEKSGYITGMTILSYGSSTWSDFIEAYNAKKVVYCRASSNANPASGSQTRMAFMAYVSDATNPTNVEFQYYRSISSHSASQQGDQVYVYKLTSGNAWTVTVREASVKITTGSSNGINATYSNGAVTIGHTNSVTAQTTQALYPFKYDAQGHITGSGSAVTSLPASDVSSWAKAATKPSYDFSEIGSKPTTLSGYGITDAKIANGTITLGSNTITPLTSFTESDPIFTASAASGITSSNITNWNNTSEINIDGTNYKITRIAKITLSGVSGIIVIYDDGSSDGATIFFADGVGLNTVKSAIEAQIPTATSDLTNDSGFIDSIKTVNNASLIGSGDVSVQPTLVSGTNIKTVNNNSLLGSGNVAVQPTLVSGTNIKTVNNQSLLGSGNISISGGGGGAEQNTWYGTSDTSASTQTKTVTTSSGDFSLSTGNIVVVKFTNAQSYSGAYKLNVDGTGAVSVMSNGTTGTVQYSYLAGETVAHVYDGTNFIAINEGRASTTYYGVTKLSSSTSSTSTTLAATPYAVKQAYDLADDASTVANAALPAASVEDYITEQDTSGSWRYRKWHSGKIEAWFEGSVTVSSTTARGQVYTSTPSALSIPPAIGFTAAPYIIIGNNANTNNIIAINGAATSATSISMTVWRPVSSSSTMTIQARIYAWQD